MSATPFKIPATLSRPLRAPPRPQQPLRLPPPPTLAVQQPRPIALPTLSGPPATTFRMSDLLPSSPSRFDPRNLVNDPDVRAYLNYLADQEADQEADPLTTVTQDEPELEPSSITIRAIPDDPTARARAKASELRAGLLPVILRQTTDGQASITLQSGADGNFGNIRADAIKYINKMISLMRDQSATIRVTIQYTTNGVTHYSTISGKHVTTQADIDDLADNIVEGYEKMIESGMAAQAQPQHLPPPPPPDIAQVAQEGKKGTIDMLPATMKRTHIVMENSLVHYRCCAPVAVSASENCLIKVARCYRAADLVDRVYSVLPDLKPGLSSEPIYMTQDDMVRAASVWKAKLHLYTDVGQITGKPFLCIGTSGKKIIHVRVANRHATVLPNRTSVDSIVYCEQHELESLCDQWRDTASVIDEIRDNPEVTTTTDHTRADHQQPEYSPLRMFGVYTMDIAPTASSATTRGHKGRYTVYKHYRPSSVTGQAEDDEDLSLAHSTNPGHTLAKVFMRTMQLADVPDPDDRSVWKASEVFIGKRKITDLVLGESYTEYDRNKSYVSYKELGPRYIGFPTDAGYYVSTPHNPALYVIDTIDLTNCIYKSAFEQLGLYSKVMVRPLYDLLVEGGAHITYKGAYDVRSFKDIDIVAFYDKYNLNDPTALKIARNSALGRTIEGGHKELKRRIFSFGCKIELANLIADCAEAKWSYSIRCGPEHSTMHEDHFSHLPDDIQGDITVHVPCVPKGKYPYHTYVLGYHNMAMLLKYTELETQGRQVVLYNVDALIVTGLPERSQDGAITTQQPTGLGQWKWTTHIKDAYRDMMVRPITDKTVKALAWCMPSAIKHPNRHIPNQHTIIYGAGGTGKSYPWLADPVRGCAVLTPRVLLKDAFIAKATELHGKVPDTMRLCTFHKMFQPRLTDAEYSEAIIKGALKQPPMYIIVDEFTMYSQELWHLALRRAPFATFVALGDFYQISDCIEGTSINSAFFTSLGFQFTEWHRPKDKPCRHSAEDSFILDRYRLAPDPSLKHRQCNLLYKDIAAGVFATAETIRGVADLNIDDIIVIGDHKTAAKYHKFIRKWATMTRGNVIRVRRETGATLIVPLDDKRIWWDRQTSTDILPDGFTLEPDMARTVDSLQGRTIDQRLIVDVVSLSARSGGLYTALTRTTKISQLVLITGFRCDLQGMMPDMQSRGSQLYVSDFQPKRYDLADNSWGYGEHEPGHYWSLAEAKAEMARHSASDKRKGRAPVCIRQESIDSEQVVHNSYKVFASKGAFYYHQQRMTKAPNRCYHEVVMSADWRPIIDIDGGAIPQYMWEAYTATFMKAFRTALVDIFGNGHQVGEDDIAIVDSSGWSPSLGAPKYSIHLRSIRYYATREQCKLLAEHMVYLLGGKRPGQLGALIDTGIYTANHCFRVLGSTKPQENRHSRVANPSVAAEGDCWVGDPQSDQPEDNYWQSQDHEAFSHRDNSVYTPPSNSWHHYRQPGKPDYRLYLVGEKAGSAPAPARKVASVEVSTELGQRIVEAAAPYTEGCRYRYRDRKHTFERRARGHCHSCNREHTSNGMYVTRKGDQILLHCHASKGSLPLVLFTC